MWKTALPAICALSLGGYVTPTRADVSDFDLNLAIDGLLNAVFEYGISTARAFAEITYQDVRFDPNLDTFFVSGMTVQPYGMHGGRDCSIFIGSINIFGNNSEYLPREKFAVGVNNLRVSKFCFPNEARGAMAMLGMGDVEIPLMEIDIEHDFRTASSQIKIFGGVKNMAELAITTDFEYLSFTMDEDFPITGKLSRVEILAENHGVWENVATQLPPAFTNPETAPDFVGDIVASGIKYDLDPPLVDYIVSEIKIAVNAFLQNPTGLILETQIPISQPVAIRPELFQNPNTLFAQLRPKISTQTLKPSTVIDRALVEQVLNNDYNGIDPAQLATIAQALGSGMGAPKNIDQAMSIYKYLVAQGDIGAHHELMEIAVQKRDFANAYSHALALAHSDDPLAPSYLNEIEKQLELSEIIQLQNAFLAGHGSGIDAKATAPFAKSLAFLNGQGVAKSYTMAYYWALISLAGGDQRTALVIDKIEAISDKLNGYAKDKWDDQLVSVRKRALENWLQNP